ncbi:MAG: 1-acyl-sn-glycerol-3-phosphate acyltransferase [Deltaproteobacteria bacterium]|nr:1-acyl-sn-glycerol-3-phosphate acyltransferase [Deltaproteobacteria bacterium]
MQRALRRVVGLSTGALSFAYLILVLNTVQMLSVVLYPFSHRAFREVNRWCARSIWGLWVLMAELQNKLTLRFTGDPLPRRENALVLPNHQTMADVMVLICFAWRCGRLGDLKWFVKEVIKYVPGPGWGMRFLDCIFVKRDWAQDQHGIARLFDKYKRESIPVFLISFLEGTRKTDAKHQSAQAFARDRGLYVPAHTLVPRTKGFIATMQGLGTHLDAVYDVTIGYHGQPPTLVDCFAAAIERIDVHVRRYPIDAIPQGEEAQTAWVFDRFREKDALLAHFHREGSFPGPAHPTRVRALDWFLPESRRHTAIGDVGDASSAH